MASHPTATAAADPMVDRQWGLSIVRAPDAWSVGRGAGAVVAVVDTGVHLAHEDLKANIVTGRNVSSDGPPSDDHGHGTHVAGIAAAVAGNGLGIASVAPDSKIMPVKVLEADEDGRARGLTSDIAEGIRWAADHGADVINLSIGDDVVVRNLLPDAMQSAIRYAWDKGAIPVLAAGNDVLFPSGYGNVDAIIVGATNRADRRASYSNDIGVAKWGMVAPGGEPDDGVLSTYWQESNPDAYAFAAGTSMAAPHVAGAAALLRSLGVGQQATVDILLDTAVDLGSSYTYGAGRLDVHAAVAVVQTPAPASSEPPPSAGPTSSRSTEPVTQNPSATEPPGDASPQPDDEEGRFTPIDPSSDTPDEPIAAPDGGSDAGGGGPVAVAGVLAAVGVLAGAGWFLRRQRRGS